MAKKKIILAENERIIALDLKNILQKHDYKVIDIIFNSSLILSYLVKQKPDLLITSLKNNFNPVAVIRTVTEQYGVPVLVVSGLQEQELAEFRKIKNCYFLKKPYQKEDLLKAVEECFTNTKSSIL